jgi:hypothetical protein
MRSNAFSGGSSCFGCDSSFSKASLMNLSLNSSLLKRTDLEKCKDRATHYQRLLPPGKMLPLCFYRRDLEDPDLNFLFFRGLLGINTTLASILPSAAWLFALVLKAWL